MCCCGLCIVVFALRLLVGWNWLVSGFGCDVVLGSQLVSVASVCLLVSLLICLALFGVV